jgi:hypothetical protein
MRRDESTRHGRAADALIASYVRELLADEPTAPTSAAAGDRAPAAEVPLALLAAPGDAPRADATA